jgi:hypothetical protein
MTVVLGSRGVSLSRLREREGTRAKRGEGEGKPCRPRRPARPLTPTLSRKRERELTPPA